MFSKLKFILGLAITLVFLQTKAETQGFSLAQIKRLQTSAVTRLESKEMTNNQKLMFAQHMKDLVEDNLKIMITEGLVDPADLADPTSELAIAFQNLDVLTLISQIEKDENGKISQKSCGEVKAMIQLSLADPNRDAIRVPTAEETKTLKIIQGLCE